MRAFIIRMALAVALVGAVGTVAASEYGDNVRVLTPPEGCSSPAACGAVCAQNPQACEPYCLADGAHTVECGQWAKAYKASGTVAIAQFSPPAGGENFGTSTGGAGMNFSQPPSGGGDHMMPPPSGDQSMMNQPPMMGQQGQQGQGTGQEQQNMMPPNMVNQPGSNMQGTDHMQPPGGMNGMMGQQGQQGFDGGRKPPGGQMFGRPGQKGDFNGDFKSDQKFSGEQGNGMMHNGMGNGMGSSMMPPSTGSDQGMQGQTQQTQSTGIDVGGGVRSTGPGGCKNPQECQQFCSKDENKKECEGFADRFERPEFKQGNFQDQQQPQGDQNGQDQSKFEEQRKHAQEQMLSQMKQGMKQMGRMIDQMKRRIASLQNRKVKIPDEVTSQLATIEDLRAKMEAATSPEDIQDIGPEMGDAVQNLNEQFGNLERLAEFPRMLAQANRMIRQGEAQIKRFETKIAVRKIDVGDTLTEAKSLLDEVKTARDAAAAAATQGDAETAFEQLQSGVFERGDDMGEKISSLQIVVEAPAKIAEKTRELRGLAQRIRQLERSGQEVSEAKGLLDDAQKQFSAIQELVKQRPLPVDELMGQVQDLENVMDQIRTAVGEDQFPTFKPFELQLPSGVPLGSTSSAGSASSTQSQPQGDAQSAQ